MQLHISARTGFTWGAPRRGRAVAGILSVVETCRRLDLPLRAYLAAVLPGLNHRPEFDIVKLTPLACRILTWFRWTDTIFHITGADTSGRNAAVLVGAMAVNPRVMLMSSLRIPAHSEHDSCLMPNGIPG